MRRWTGASLGWGGRASLRRLVGERRALAEAPPRDGGRGAARPSPGRTPSISQTPEERRALWRQLEENPEATLEEHRELWERGRARVGLDDEPGDPAALGWTYKQRRWEPPSETRRPEPAGASG